MANVFNSVKGLHPKRNAFSAHTYRNDFTSKLGVNIPVYIQHVTAGTRVHCSASALVRLQALISPIMDNLDYYVHFWQVPYRILEDDRFTSFFTGENELEDATYDAMFVTPKEFMDKLLMLSYTEESSIEDAATIVTQILDNGGLLDFCGYDKKLFHYNSIAPVVGQDNVYEFRGANNTTKLNFRNILMYYLLHEHWYMNENVPYYGVDDAFIQDVKSAIKGQDLDAFVSLIYYSHANYGCGGLLPHGWEKDYFTSALPNVQVGDPVTLSLAGSAPVAIPLQDITLSGRLNPTSFGERIVHVFDANLDGVSDLKINPIGGGYPDLRAGSLMDSVGETEEKQILARSSQLEGEADLSEASAITINELRFANALQKFKERQMRFGRRRLEFYKGFFDVVPEDLRLQVPKYLGGGRIPINISDIEQTSATSGSSALGHLAGKGTAVAGGFAGFTTFCSEESIIMGIAFAMPHITYANSISKFLLKTDDIYDYFNPSFEHLGEQAIKKIEIYSGATSPDGDFGYTPRYNEYRFHANEMHGEFKNTLAFWTLGRIFNNQPALNDKFVYMQPSNFDRIFAVSNQPAMLVSMLFRQRIIQPVSKFGTPMLLA